MCVSEFLSESENHIEGVETSVKAGRPRLPLVGEIPHRRGFWPDVGSRGYLRGKRQFVGGK